MLYVIPVPVRSGAVIVPVATAHVGLQSCSAVGAAGVAGCVLVTLVGAEIHPAAF
jgi:hypothetical protein